MPNDGPGCGGLRQRQELHRLPRLEVHGMKNCRCMGR